MALVFDLLLCEQGSVMVSEISLRLEIKKCARHTLTKAELCWGLGA